MRADRLVSLVLLLRHRGRLTAQTLARELDVSPRTVLRDIEALSAAGVPVYAERGRHGGFELLPGFRTELTGLSHEEALALLVAGTARGDQVFGLGSALASAVRKVLDALPESHRTAADEAARRFLVDPEVDFTVHRAGEESHADVMGEVRRAVAAGHRLRILYAATDGPARWRTVDPVGLVTVRGRAYLLAVRAGSERTYRLSRVQQAQELDEPAERPDLVDLGGVWRDRCAQFLSGLEQVVAHVLVDPAQRERLVESAVAVRADGTDADGRLRLEVTFQDAEHAEFALWRHAASVEVTDPPWLRAALRERAAAVADRYGAADVPRPESATR